MNSNIEENQKETTQTTSEIKTTQTARPGGHSYSANGTSRPGLRRRHWPRCILICAALIWPATGARLHACGPDFPNTLLDSGDAVLLAAPVAGFARELARMKLGPPKFTASPATNGYAEETLSAELRDLRLALRRSKTPADERDRILAQYEAERRKLEEQVQALNLWKNYHDWIWVDGERRDKPRPAKPEWKEITIVAGLPGEFSDYFRGCIAYHRDETNDARQAWQALLQRPPGERHFRSTWAAYMLGRLCDTDEPDKALNYYADVRAMAKAGFADSLGLAAATIGWEARMQLGQKHFEQAIALYLQQYSAGDPSAVVSLRLTASRALDSEPETLAALAANPATRQVLTSFVIARGGSRNETSRWLDALEAAGVKDVEAAEELALAAYQNDDMEASQRWIKRSSNSPVAKWLQTKLWLRAGKVDNAAALLAGVSRQFAASASTNPAQPASLADTLVMDYSDHYPDHGSVASQALGELGVLRLARREYRESLDALLRSGYWMDAAYVAERVLSVDELKSYVDSEWPLDRTNHPPATADAAQSDVGDWDRTNPAEPGGEIRYLLARRLTRLSRGKEARQYYPTNVVASYDALMNALDAGWDEGAPAEKRAASLFEAATITRREGLELIGTEVAPDWHAVGAEFEMEMTVTQRATNDAKINHASDDEAERYARNDTDPEQRFHYRYQAATLALEASRLLPNNTDLTARILCTAGSWLKYRDPQTADYFYKLLVNRCRKTPLGEAADRKRWFPILDEQGNMAEPAPKSGPATAPTPDEPMQTDPPPDAQPGDPSPPQLSVPPPELNHA